MARLLRPWGAMLFVVGCAALRGVKEASAVKMLKHPKGACPALVFDRVDAELHIRTSVVEDSTGTRHLLLTNDTVAAPCHDFVDGSSQGLVQCRSRRGAGPDACGAHSCDADPSEITHSYVRTMLASAMLQPDAGQGGAGAQLMHRAWRPGSQVLVLGLGSSTMAYWLRSRLPHVALHVAELVPAVAEAAPCFGLNTSDEGLKIHVGDGRGYLQRSADGQYDAILVDAFDPDSEAEFPTCMRTREFYELARRKLAAGGVMSLNLWKEEEHEASQRIRKSIGASFGEVWVGEHFHAVQEVVAAFAPRGGAEVATEEAHGEVGASLLQQWSPELTRDVTEWSAVAKFKPMDTERLRGMRLLSDLAECHVK